MKHTQGTWTVKNGAYIGQYVIKEFDDKVNDLSLRKKPLLWDENAANKALISAAPALLEALKKARRYIVDYADIPVMKRVLPIIDKAIAQAEE